MDTITKAMLFDGKAIVSIVDAKELTNQALKYHKPSNGAGEVLGRVLAITAFMSDGMKGASLKMSVTIGGEGMLGKVVACGVTGGKVRGFIEHKSVEIPAIGNGRNDIRAAIGDGEIVVIKDFGLKGPYVGRCALLRGDIDSDFAYYFTTSEQLPSAVASGCKIVNGKAVSCGAIIVQPMPNCDDNILTVLEDIVSNFTDFGALLESKTAKEIVDYYFGHFECKFISETRPEYRCICSRDRMNNIVRSMGYDECMEIIEEMGQIEIHCDFCNTYFRYGKADISKLFGR